MSEVTTSELRQRIEQLEAENRALRDLAQSSRVQAEQTLAQTLKHSDFLDKIIRNAAQPMAIGYADGGLGIVNRAFEELTGYTAEEVRAMGWVALTPPEWRQMEWDKLAEQRRTGLPIRYEKEYVRKDGTRVPIELLVHMVPDSAGNPEYYYSFVTDITQRKQAEKLLWMEKERSELAQRATGVGVFDWDMVNDIAYLSSEWLRMYGLPEGTGGLKHEQWLSLVHPDDRAAAGARGLAAARSGEPYEDEFRVVWPDQSVHWIRTGGRTVFAADGKAQRFVGTAMDVTRVKQIEIALRESENRYRALFERMNEGFVVHEVIFDEAGKACDLRYIAVNPAFERQTGLKAEEIIGRSIHDFFPEAETLWFERYGKVVLTGEPAVFDAWFAPLDRCFEIRAFRTEFHRVAVLFSEITQRKKSEEALRENEERIRLATEATGVGIWEWNVLTGNVRGDAQMFQIYGISPTADGIIPFAAWKESVHPDDLAEQERILQEAIRSNGRSSREFRIRRAGESDYRHIQSVETTRTNARGQVEWVVGTNVDITDRKRAELALREGQKQNEFLARLIRDASQPLAIAYPDGGIGLVNKAFEQLTGYTAEELRSIGRGPLTPPEYHDFERGQLAELHRTGQPVRYRKEYVRKDGTRVPVELLVQLVPESESVSEYYYTFVTDITAAWKAAEELAKAKEAAENASAAKDQFLAVLSHELRTPLAPVRMAISMWEREKDSLPEKFRQDLSMIRRNVDLECRLIDDMLDLNRIARGKLDLQFARVDVHEEVRHAMQTVEADALVKQIVISFDPDATEATVVGDAARLQQVLWNLLKNAVKFTPPGGSVAIKTYNTPDGQIGVEVRDTGRGIEPEVMKRIFHAFEQGGQPVTRQFGGLGLGLAISKALVEMHGGTLDGFSDGKGRGAIFTLALGLAAPPEMAADDRKMSRAPIGLPADHRDRLIRILLVEDHSDTAQIMKRLLGSLGYDVETAGTVSAALATARAHEFDLIISDVGLPDGSGYDLMRQVLAHRPTKGIALTGYGMEEDVQQGMDAGFLAHLTKPINIEQLELTIQRVIGTGLKRGPRHSPSKSIIRNPL